MTRALPEHIYLYIQIQCKVANVEFCCVKEQVILPNLESQRFNKNKANSAHTSIFQQWRLIIIQTFYTI